MAISGGVVGCDGRRFMSTRAPRRADAGWYASRSMVLIRWIALGLLFLSLTACSGSTVTPTSSHPGVISDSVRTYLTEMISVMQASSVNRNRIDWADFSRQVMAQAQADGASSISSAYGAIRVALGLLADGHSFYQSITGTLILSPVGPTNCTGRTASSMTVPSDIGYVQVLGITDEPGTAAAQAYAEFLTQGIQMQDGPNIVGWIVDLRGNFGGDSLPMLAGVGSILGEGLFGYFVDANGGFNPLSYTAGGVTFNGEALPPRVGRPYTLRHPNPKVAVIANSGTTSAGEFVAIAFRNRPQTRSFGGPTCGASSSNAAFKLSDGATLAVTNGLDADRARVVYQGPVIPDELTFDDQRMIDWLRQ